MKLKKELYKHIFSFLNARDFIELYNQGFCICSYCPFLKMKWNIFNILKKKYPHLHYLVLECLYNGKFKHWKQFPNFYVDLSFIQDPFFKTIPLLNRHSKYLCIVAGDLNTIIQYRMSLTKAEGFYLICHYLWRRKVFKSDSIDKEMYQILYSIKNVNKFDVPFIIRIIMNLPEDQYRHLYNFIHRFRLFCYIIDKRIELFCNRYFNSMHDLIYKNMLLHSELCGPFVKGMIYWYPEFMDKIINKDITLLIMHSICLHSETLQELHYFRDHKESKNFLYTLNKIMTK